MTIRITFDGWVNDVKTFDWGNVLKMSHDRRATNAAGEWETVGKDYLDVVVTDEQLQWIADQKLVHVEGTLKATAFIKKDGTAGPDLKVTATHVQALKRDQAAEPVRSAAIPDEDLPF